MTKKVVHHDRNGRFACNFFHCDVIIFHEQKLWALKVVKNEDPKMQLLHEHGSRRGKVIQHDRSDNISHTTYLF